MAERSIPWQDLQIFLATAQLGTLAAAAEALDVSAATVHRRLAHLEQSLGARLFVRSNRGYLLTDSGQDLRAHALAVDGEVRAAERLIGGRDQAMSGLVRLSTVDDLFVGVLGALVRDYLRMQPRVRIDVAIDAERADLAQHEADVAIRTGAPPAEGDVIARRVCGVGVALYASRGYLQRHGAVSGLDALGAHRFVRADKARSKLPMERFLERHVSPTGTELRSNSMLARQCAVREGLGMLPCFSADVDPALVRIGAPRPEASAALWEIVHADLRRNARVRSFV
ncbi:MAG: LysR family transcriptional regulator, partial [Rhizobacter sp.]|nr:LysR family transcriptional regulator [Rhizobacter sp.]